MSVAWVECIGGGTILQSVEYLGSSQKSNFPKAPQRMDKDPLLFKPPKV